MSAAVEDNATDGLTLGDTFEVKISTLGEK